MLKKQPSLLVVFRLNVTWNIASWSNYETASNYKQ